MTALLLPSTDGSLSRETLGEPAHPGVRGTPPVSRSVYAAAHVVADPLRSAADSGPHIDWDATLRQRHRLWDLGLGVAEAMDTAQRGMGLDWPSARELITRTLAEARARRGAVLAGVATDQLPDTPATLSQVRDAYAEQLTAVEAEGGSAVLMASRHLAAAARDPEDYLAVYAAVLGVATKPVVLHWLGAIFDPELTGYWGRREPRDAMRVVLDLIAAHPGVVSGIKVSLLDAELECALRAALPDGVRLYTGDDFHYTELIVGDGTRHSDALLGAFAVVARHASAALARLDDGDEAGFQALLGPTEPLSRLLFAAPTRYYKTGVAWLAYLDGDQDHFRMLGGLESGRSLGHLGDLVRAANRIGHFRDPELTAARAARFLAAHGIG